MIKISGKIFLNTKNFSNYLGIIKEATATTVSESTTIRTKKSTKNVIITKAAEDKLSGIIFKLIMYS